MTGASSGPVRVLHITDPHLFAVADGNLRGTVTHSTLAAVLNHYRNSGWNADIIAMTGDVIQDDTAEAYERFRQHMTPLGLPVYCVPGNHDIRPLMQQALTPPPFHYCASVEIGNWLLTGVDSCLEGDAAGHISDEEMDRLAQTLSGTSAQHIAICLHHPPVAVGSQWLDQVGLRNSAEFLDLISSSGKVRTTLSGHVHQECSAECNGIEIIGTPSTCRQFKPGSNEFALDDKPPAYRRVNLHTDGRVNSELVWIASNP